jgi:hypothetical protein
VISSIGIGPNTGSSRPSRIDPVVADRRRLALAIVLDEPQPFRRRVFERRAAADHPRQPSSPHFVQHVAQPRLR